jgi:MoxR-like ATPase
MFTIPRWLEIWRRFLTKTKDKIQRPPAERLHADELKKLLSMDKAAKPPGWKMSLQAVRKFIVGDEELGIEAKFVGNPSLVDRAMVTLATQRGLMLVGEPGTAKSFLSELLAAAICGCSTHTVQGGASITEDQIKYSWNYALLVAEGPSEKSLIPAPLYKAMVAGQVARFEEITRCPLEVQDSLLSLLSDRVMSVPELEGDQSMLFAREGFNLIATANTRDRGVNEMSAALKRRLNFETVFPIADFRIELDLVCRESSRLLQESGVPKAPPQELMEVLVTTFRELRQGQAAEGQSMERLSTILSTAEAVSVAHSMGVRGWYLREEQPNAKDMLESLAGTAGKDDPEDLKKVRKYLEQQVRQRGGPYWTELYESRHLL